jgi:NADH dehydrogenase FAD-containing subunit
VLADFQVSAIGNVFLLGCLEKRVTLYSQQVRAINLAAALIDEGRIKANSRVAIIGGGAAGITAAAAIARAIPNITDLHVYERRSKILHLQTQSTFIRTSTTGHDQDHSSQTPVCRS